MKKNIFAHIDNLDELKPYICPKAVSVRTRDWEAVCQECRGKCDAGKRAIQILEEAAKPDISKKTGGPGIVSAKMLAGRDAWNEKQHERAFALARETFAKAAEGNCNPAEILAGIIGTDVTSARKRIDLWIKKHPDLDRELNMKAIMDRYVKRRKQRTSVLSKEASDEISIGDILKAADEGHLKTDSVEETESGVCAQAHIEAAQKQLNKKLAQRDAITLSEFREKIGPDPLRSDEYPLVGEGGFTVDNPFPCEAAPVPLSPSQMFPDGEGGFWVAGQEAVTCEGQNTNEHDNVIRPGHYTFGAIEVIDYIRDKMTPEMFQGFCMGNVLKYVSRHKHKNGVEDLKKANVYLGWLIESEEADKNV